MPETSAEKTNYYRSLRYEDLEKMSRGSMPEAFQTFVPFVSKLSQDVQQFFTGARDALSVAKKMAESILSSASSARYGDMTDREMLACLKVQETHMVLKSLLILCANYIGGDPEEIMNDEQYMLKVDPVRDALKEATIGLQIVALPLTNS